MFTSSKLSRYVWTISEPFTAIHSHIHITFAQKMPIVNYIVICLMHVYKNHSL